MKLSLPAQIEKLIEDRVKSGKYQSCEDVITAAMASLDQQESIGDFQSGELDTLLEEGEASGSPIDGEQVFAELRALREQHQNKAG